MSKKTTIQTRKTRKLKKNRNLIDVIVVVQTRVIREKEIKHFFILVTFKSHDNELIIFRIMIDSRAIFNFISQIKIKKMKLDKFDNISSDLKTLDETSLRVYQEHTLQVNVSNNSDRERFDNHKILNVVMIEIDMILNFF